MRRDGRLLVLAGTAAGLALAVVVTVLQTSTYRADASIALVHEGQPPGDEPALAQAAAAAADLFHSRAVAEPAIANLRLDELNWYVESFRGVAEENGALPGGVDFIVEDVFKELIERAGTP